MFPSRGPPSSSTGSRPALSWPRAAPGLLAERDAQGAAVWGALGGAALAGKIRGVLARRCKHFRECSPGSW